MQIYVGNLPPGFSDEDLRALFETHGVVRSAVIGRDRKTGESQGYGFVEMAAKSDGRAAIEALRGKEMDGKPLRARALKPGDDFHQHAMSLQTGPHGAPKISGKTFSGNVGSRASGAIRRGGKRGG